MQSQLKVDPEVLVSKADELKGHRGTVHNLMEEARTQIDSLKSTWNSDSSILYHAKFRGIQDDIERVLSFIDEYDSDLRELATTYKTSENAAISATDALPVDGVFSS